MPHNRQSALIKPCSDFSLLSGIGGGSILIGLVRLFQPFMPPTLQAANLNIALWKRLLAAFYGGITEELLLRLFLLPLLAWVLWKIARRGGKPPANWVYWGTIALSARLFSIAHLPAAASVWSLTPIVVIRTLALNSLMGIAFGFLYWQ